MREEKKHAEVGKRVRNTRKDQSKAGVINFILTGLHAACMHCMQSACRAVKIELKPGLNLMRVPDAPQSALIIRMDMQSPLTALHASCMHCMQTCQDCECCLKSKSLSDMWLPDPYPMQGFLWKGGSSYFTPRWVYAIFQHNIGKLQNGIFQEAIKLICKEFLEQNGLSKSLKMENIVRSYVWSHSSIVLASLRGVNPGLRGCNQCYVVFLKIAHYMINQSYV